MQKHPRIRKSALYSPNEMMKLCRDPQWLRNPLSSRLVGKFLMDEAVLNGGNREMKQLEIIYHAEMCQLEDLQPKTNPVPRFPEPDLRELRCILERGALPSHMAKGRGPVQSSPVFPTKSFIPTLWRKRGYSCGLKCTFTSA